jgi:nitronate monooxygenase
MALKTRLTERFQIQHPILLAPMTPAAGGALAAAVTAGGGLGLLGGGYGDRAWLDHEFAQAGNQRIGCGFITWSMAQDPALLDIALAHKPAAIMLSFADPAPFAPRIHAAGVPLICQVHTTEHALRALDAGAAVLVAQGTEAGGHGLTARSTMAFVPAIADLLAARGSRALLVAAGGIADGRGLAAALMLGADGVLMGTRFWATQEALIHHAAKRKVLDATGDETIRTRVYDVVRQKAWPSGYTGRLLRNGFIDMWHGREEELSALQGEKLAAVEAAYDAGDYDVANVTVGEAVGLIHDVPRAAELVGRIAAEAEAKLAFGGAMAAVA